MDKPRATVEIEISGGWEYTTQEILDWIEMKLDAEPRDPDWGAGRGGINYAKGRITAVRLVQ